MVFRIRTSEIKYLVTSSWSFLLQQLWLSTNTFLVLKHNTNCWVTYVL